MKKVDKIILIISLLIIGLFVILKSSESHGYIQNRQFASKDFKDKKNLEQQKSVNIKLNMNLVKNEVELQSLQEKQEGQLIVNEMILNECFDDKLKVKFLCNPDWELLESENAISLIISEEPKVTFSIVMITKEVKFISQLNKDILKNIGEYKEGFKSESASISGRKFIKVDALSENNDNIRLTDYYVTNRGKLYGILFSVEPSENWVNYKFTIRQLIESFEFIK